MPTQNKMCEMLTSGVVPFHDNARPYTAGHTQALLLWHFNWELFDHPPYSPVLALSHYDLSTFLNNWMRSKNFNNNEELMEGVNI
jgi:hypothetical protein